MSTWMSIGFDPDQMDAVTEPSTQVAMGGARDEVALPPVVGLDQARPSELRPVSGLNDSRTHWLAGALKHLVARHRTTTVPDWTS
jgi:hypothetical protein